MSRARITILVVTFLITFLFTAGTLKYVAPKFAAQEAAHPWIACGVERSCSNTDMVKFYQVIEHDAEQMGFMAAVVVVVSVAAVMSFLDFVSKPRKPREER